MGGTPILRGKANAARPPRRACERSERKHAVATPRGGLHEVTRLRLRSHPWAPKKDMQNEATKLSGPPAGVNIQATIMPTTMTATMTDDADALHAYVTTASGEAFAAL
jgi:hypothetical protein